MEVRVVDRDDLDLNAGYFGTDCNAVPRKQFIFFRVKRDVCLVAVRVDMPEICDHFFHTFFSQVTLAYPFSQKGKRIKGEIASTDLCKGVFENRISTKNLEYCVKE